MTALKIFKSETKSKAIKFTLNDDKKFVGRAYLYLITNDLHDAPYGLIEDVFVLEEFRDKGYGTKLVKLAINEAKKLGCTKLIGTSRRSRTAVHQWYKKLGFCDYGVEFRMDFKNNSNK